MERIRISSGCSGVGKKAFGLMLLPSYIASKFRLTTPGSSTLATISSASPQRAFPSREVVGLPYSDPKETRTARFGSLAGTSTQAVRRSRE
jgi:hypothetical protein